MNNLDYLIREKEIVAFHRSEGWVQSGRDPIRSAQHPSPRLGNRLDDSIAPENRAVRTKESLCTRRKENIPD